MSRQRVAACVGLFGLALLLWVPPPAAKAASFPCSRATTPDEIAICNTPDLNDQDVELATRYSMLLQLLPMGGAGDLRDAQRQWLAQRQSCGRNINCLESAYAARIAQLKSAFQQIVSRGPY